MIEIGLNERKELLKRVPLFSTLADSELTLVARYSAFYQFEKDEVIFEPGSSTDEIHIIDDGDVIVSKGFEEGHTIVVARFISGDHFGELDLLDNTPRNAQATAEALSRILIFPAKGFLFTDIIAHYPEVFAPVLHKLMGILSARLRTVNKLVSEKTPWIEDLKTQLYRDKVTGAYNSAFIKDELPNFSHHVPLSFLVVKPDNFKEINDRFGHEAGDAALVHLSDMISSALRGADLLVRYKGNEFCIIMPNISLYDAGGAAQRIYDAIKNSTIKTITDGVDFFITVSIGISVYPGYSRSAASLVDDAYAKLYEARSNGGARILSQIEREE